ncbi:MAG TPA: curli-like amyloid fiber formation chaperone CsgH [Noviherbaspirillum sp.]|uniref:curli-like amyloid fiber formation chaperone CsgH n=1 Tax=Noviherbaspirillum sp. TaxID=1926288 RepID=UPI002B4979FD|nr:curli-like amyloid fiber formation chaperone CsgH [Noviherbaspirillum sp.]HJV84716.1 curli-like amyloid fiber formation chaperone CsgH [Noviherbaspirillum sp.]
MVADANLQVWLDTQANVGQTLLVPYVKSVTERQISFRLDVIQRGGSGTSRVSQHGVVKAAAEAPTSLGRVALGVQKNAQCSIELQLKEDGRDLGVYHFECSR